MWTWETLAHEFAIAHVLTCESVGDEEGEWWWIPDRSWELFTLNRYENLRRVVGGDNSAMWAVATCVRIAPELMEAVSRRRTVARTRAFKRDLIAVTWHPRRVSVWDRAGIL